MHESIQELQSNDYSVTDDTLILVSQKFEDDKGLCVGNDDEKGKAYEIPSKKQNWRVAVQLMSHFSLHHKNLRKTKDGIWRMTIRTMKSMKVCKKYGKMSVAAIEGSATCNLDSRFNRFRQILIKIQGSTFE